MSYYYYNYFNYSNHTTTNDIIILYELINETIKYFIYSHNRNIIKK